MINCPVCESERVLTTVKNESFVYGSGATAKTLTALIPVHRCDACGFSFTGEGAEAARDRAVRMHLDIYMPEEIVSLRKKRDLTQRQFAECSKIGIASLARWETGQTIQNPALDLYLFLLSFDDNWQRLTERQTNSTSSQSVASFVSQARPPRLRVVDPENPDLIIRKNRFSLFREAA